MWKMKDSKGIHLVWSPKFQHYALKSLNNWSILMFAFPLLPFASLFDLSPQRFHLGNSPSHSRTRFSRSLDIPSFHLQLFCFKNFFLLIPLGWSWHLPCLKLEAHSSIRFAECILRTFSLPMLLWPLWIHFSNGFFSPYVTQSTLLRK